MLVDDFSCQSANKKKEKNQWIHCTNTTPDLKKYNPSNSYQYPLLPKKKLASFLLRSQPFLWGQRCRYREKPEHPHPRGCEWIDGSISIEVVDVVVEPGGFPLIEFGSFHDSPVGGE